MVNLNQSLWHRQEVEEGIELNYLCNAFLTDINAL